MADQGNTIDPDDQAQNRAGMQTYMGEKSQKDAESSLIRPDGTAGYLYDYVEYISKVNRQKTFSGVVRDITERRRENAGRRHTEISRMESAARLQSFVEQLPGMPYIANLDHDGSNMYVSPKIEELLGFTPEQWCADPELRIRQLHPEDRDRVLNAIRQAVNAGSAYNIDYRIYSRDGGLCWFHDEARVMVDDAGKPLFLQGAILDITERKQAQEELERSHSELQELITALDSLRVEEQKRLAHEMHDDFGQLLAAMKIDLCTLRKHLPQQDSKVVKYLSSINELVDTMVTSVRRIIADLPPKMVEDMGLFNALESMTRNFEARHRIRCRLQVSAFELELETKIATAVYRMVQETLNNAAKHAHATLVEVRVDFCATHIALKVKDDGIGMTLDCQRKSGSFGLIGMRERATALGGEMKIESRNGEGTAVHIVIPVNTSEAHKPRR